MTIHLPSVDGSRGAKKKKEEPDATGAQVLPSSFIMYRNKLTELVSLSAVRHILRGCVQTAAA